MSLPRVLIDDRRSSAAGTPGPMRIVTPSSLPPVPVVRTFALPVPGSCAVTRLLPTPPQPLPVVRSWEVPRARRAPASAHAATASTPIVRVPSPRVATLPAPQPIAAAAHNVPEPPADLTRRSKRKSIGSDFASHADLEAAKQAREVEELIAIMPPRVASTLLGGEPGVMQVPDPVDRAKTLADAVALKRLDRMVLAWPTHDALWRLSQSTRVDSTSRISACRLRRHLWQASCARRVSAQRLAPEHKEAPRSPTRAAWASCGLLKSLASRSK